MGVIKPWLGQGYVMRLEPSRRAATIVGVVLMVAALLGLLALRSRRLSMPATVGPGEVTPDTLTAITWMATAVLLLGFLLALVNGRRWRLNRTIVRLSKTGEGRALRPRTEWTVEAARAQQIPALSIEDGWTRRRHRLRRRLNRVTSSRNVIGEKPMRIAYLRIFDNQPRARTFLQGAWREFGYVYMLRSASSVSPAEFRRLRRSGIDTMFVESTGDLERELALGEASPQHTRLRSFRQLAPTTVRTYDRYGAYPPVAVLCHGSYWRAAVDELLLRVDAVCLDLSGFRPKHEGTGYELQRVVDRFPIERVLFLGDPKSNVKFLVGEIDRAWRQMSADSPNAHVLQRTTHLARTDRLRITITRNEHGQETGRETRLIAQRKQTRRIAAGLQLSLAHAPPVRRQPWGKAAPAVAPPPAGGPGRRASVSSPAGWVAALAMTLLATFGVAIAAPGLDPGGYGSNQAVAPGPSAVVPYLVGKSERRAQGMLRRLGLVPSVARIAAEQDPGTVLRQSPRHGFRLPAGSTVFLLVSSGASPTASPSVSPDPAMTQVPEIEGLLLVDAVPAIAAAQLLYHVDEDHRDSWQPADTVLDCDPDEGEPVPEGTVVELVVASGWNEVPEVRGLDEEEARDRLNAAGFVAVVETETETDVEEPGVVMDQSIRAESTARVGSTVKLTVAVAPTPTATPTVTVQPTPSEAVPTPTPTP